MPALSPVGQLKYVSRSSSSRRACPMSQTGSRAQAGRCFERTSSRSAMHGRCTRSPVAAYSQLMESPRAEEPVQSAWALWLMTGRCSGFPHSAGCYNVCVYSPYRVTTCLPQYHTERCTAQYSNMRCVRRGGSMDCRNEGYRTTERSNRTRASKSMCRKRREGGQRCKQHSDREIDGELLRVLVRK